MIERFARARDEDGVALLIALAFLSLFGVFVAAVLSFADTSFRSTLSLRGFTSEINAAQGGVDGAINYIRSNGASGVDPAAGGSCPATGSLPNFSSNGSTPTVTCQGQSGSGVRGTGSASKPKFAVLTLGTAATGGGEPGIEQTSNAQLDLGGSIFSNSTIKQNGGSSAVMAVNGTVNAIGNCVGTIVSTQPPIHCANTDRAAVPSEGVDPNYAKATNVVPTLRSVPPCPLTRVVTLQPGLYTDASALNALTDGSCGGLLLHLPAATSPAGVGVYYFNFKNAGSHAWVMNDSLSNIVGGTPKGWVESSLVRPVVTFPGACKTEDDTGVNDGVQLIFGGDSRIEVGGSAIELCAQPSTSQQQIAIYGLSTGTATATGPVAVNSSTVTTSSNFVAGTTARAIGPADDLTADVNAAVPTASLTLGGYGLSIPAGSVINNVTMTVRHRDEAKVGSVATTITPTSGSACSAIAGTVGTSLHNDSNSASVSACLDTVTKLAGFTATFTATRTTTSTMLEHLDAIVFTVTYTPPAFEAQSGCLAQVPYPAPGACALLLTRGSKPDVSIQGTIYAPKAAIDLELTNVVTQTVTRGVVCRMITIKVTPSSGFSGTPVGLPAAGPPADRIVDFTASVGGNVRLRATVNFTDGNGLTPGLVVTIVSWVIQR